MAPGSSAAVPVACSLLPGCSRSPWLHTQRGITASYGDPVSRFLRNHEMVHSGCTASHPRQSSARLPHVRSSSHLLFFRSCPDVCEAVRGDVEFFLR